MGMILNDELRRMWKEADIKR